MRLKMQIPNLSFCCYNKYMQKIAQPLIFLALFIALLAPGFTLAQEQPDSLVPCDNSTEETKCDFTALMSMINKVINFILFKLAIPIAAIMFAYAGFRMVISGGSSESMTTAKSIFFNTVVGLLLAAGAWLIISTILAIMGYDGAWIGLLVKIGV